MRTEQMQCKAAFALAGAIADVQALEIFGDGKNLRVSAWAAAKVDDAAVKIAAKLRGVGIVAVEKGDAVRRQRFNSSNLARAMPAWPSAKFSMCAVPTLVITPQSGAAMRASAAISPA